MMHSPVCAHWIIGRHVKNVNTHNGTPQKTLIFTLTRHSYKLVSFDHFKKLNINIFSITLMTTGQPNAIPMKYQLFIHEGNTERYWIKYNKMPHRWTLFDAVNQKHFPIFTALSLLKFKICSQVNTNRWCVTKYLVEMIHNIRMIQFISNIIWKRIVYLIRSKRIERERKREFIREIG